MNKFDQMQPIANKVVDENGNITTFDGAVVDMSTATEKYKKMQPWKNEMINPDGSTSPLPFGGGGGGGGTVYHNALQNRFIENQHNIASIQGLSTQLGTLSTNITTNRNEISSLKTSVGSKADLPDPAQSVTQNIKQINRNEEDNFNKIEELEDSITAVEGDIETLGNDLGDLGNALNILAAFIGDKTGLPEVALTIVQNISKLNIEKQEKILAGAGIKIAADGKTISADAGLTMKKPEGGILPPTGESNIIYLIPFAEPGKEDQLQQYIWVDGEWVLLGDLNPSLTDYFTKTEMNALLENKVDKVVGKGLSTNDFDNLSKDKLNGLKNYDDTDVRNEIKTNRDNIGDKSLLPTPSKSVCENISESYDQITLNKQKSEANEAAIDNLAIKIGDTSLLPIEDDVSGSIEKIATTTASDSELGLVKTSNTIEINSDFSIDSVSSRNLFYSRDLIKKMASGETTKIICYGDNKEPYSSNLQSLLRKIYRNNGITVLNKGDSSWRTNEAIANLQSQVLNENPDHIIISFAINDIKGSTSGPANSFNDYILNLEQLIKLIGNIRISLMSPTPIKTLTIQGEGENTLEIIEKVKNISEIVRTICEKFGLAFVDTNHFFEGLFSSKNIDWLDYLVDGTHLTPQGYDKIAEGVLLYLNILKKHIPSDVITPNSQNVIFEKDPTGTHNGLGFYDQENLDQEGSIGISIRTSNSSSDMRDYRKATLIFMSTQDAYAKIWYQKTNTGNKNGAINVNGKKIPVDFYNEDLNPINAYIIEKINYGKNEIYLDSTDYGSITTGNYSELFLGEVRLLNKEVYDFGEQIGDPSILDPIEGWDGSISDYLKKIYELKVNKDKIASPDELGLIKVGAGLALSADGKLYIANATQTEAGILEIALDDDISKGIEENKAVNPKQVKQALNNINAIQILNKDENINTSLSLVQNTATTFIQNEYSRNPKNLDGLILTVTDLGNAKRMYVWTENSSLWIDYGSFEANLTGYVKKTDVINNLKSTSIDSPLSANQGRELDVKKQDNLTGIDPIVIDNDKNIKLNIDDKTIKVDDDGKLYSVAGAIVASNPNLFDNGSFLINQRRKTTYSTFTSDSYSVDRWKMYATVNTISTVSKTSYGIDFNVSNTAGGGKGYLVQAKDNDWSNRYLRNQWITITMELLEPASIERIVYGYNNDAIGIEFTEPSTKFVATMKVPDVEIATKSEFQIVKSDDGTLKIKYIKLELGQVSTAFSPKPYTEELEECKRYYQMFGKSGNTTYIADGVWANPNADGAYYMLPTLTQKIKLPKIKLTGEIREDSMLTNNIIDMNPTEFFYESNNYLSNVLLATIIPSAEFRVNRWYVQGDSMLEFDAEI